MMTENMDMQLLQAPNNNYHYEDGFLIEVKCFTVHHNVFSLLGLRNGYAFTRYGILYYVSYIIAFCCCRCQSMTPNLLDDITIIKTYFILVSI